MKHEIYRWLKVVALFTGFFYVVAWVAFVFVPEWTHGSVTLHEYRDVLVWEIPVTLFFGFLILLVAVAEAWQQTEQKQSRANAEQGHEHDYSRLDLQGSMLNPNHARVQAKKRGQSDG